MGTNATWAYSSTMFTGALNPAHEILKTVLSAAPLANKLMEVRSGNAMAVIAQGVGVGESVDEVLDEVVVEVGRREGTSLEGVGVGTAP